MKKYRLEIKWAIIFSVMVLVWMLLEKISGLHGRHIDKHLYLTNLFTLPAVALFVLALKDKKKRDYGGRMNYKQGLLSGVILSLMIAIISPLTQWITSYIITPEYFPNVIAHALETGYYTNRAEAEAYFNYPNYALQGAIGALVMGIVTTLVVMLFLKSPKGSAGKGVENNVVNESRSRN